MNDDDWLNETILGGEVSWEEQEDGSFTQKVVLHLKDGRDITNIVQSGLSKKELFELRLKGDDQWPPTETTLTLMAS